MATIGSLSVKVDADTSGLSTGLNKAAQTTTDFEGKIGSLSNKLKVVGPLAVAAGAAFAVSMVKSVADTADQLAKLSARTGVAVEDLSRLQYAAGLSGVSNETLTSSIERLSRGMSEASMGAGSAGQAFAAMGLEVKNQDGSLKSQSKMMSELAEKFANYKDGAEKTALAQQIFGKSGAQLIPLLNSGAKGLKDMADESDRLGNTISTKTAKAAEQFNDNMTRMNTAAGGLARTISGPVIEALADFTGGLFQAYVQGETLFGAFSAGFKRMAQAKDIDEATRKVAELEAEYAKTMKSMAHLEPWEQATGGAMGLAMRLDEAKARLAELNAEQEKAAAEALNPAKGNAPVVDTEAAKAREAEAKARADELEKIREHELAKVQAFIDALKLREEARVAATMTEQEQEAERYLLEQEKLLEALELGLITKGEYQLMEQEALLAHREAMANIDMNALDEQLAREQAAADERVRNEEKAQELITNARLSAANAAVGFLNVLGQKNKAAAVAAVALGKALSIAQAIQNTAVGVMAAYKIDPTGALAARVAAMGKIQVGLIAATGLLQAGSIVSGGGGGGVGGGTASGDGFSSAGSVGGGTGMGGTTTAAPAQGQTVTIQLQGDVFGRDQVRSLITQINEAVADGSVLRIA
jgi:hypothetical protein